MLVTRLSDGSLLNGVPASGKQNIRPGNTVFCFEKELGISGRTKFDLISEGPEVSEEEKADGKAKAQEALPVIQKRTAPGYYDVVNPVTGKAYNEKALRKDAAEAFLAELTEGLGNPEVKDDLDELGWDDLVKVIEERGIAWNDDWQNEDDLRAALRVEE